MVLVVANTTRLLEGSLLEAAQTLGASRRMLLTRVIIPGIMPNLYRDMRILLGWAWTYLIVAELIGASSGISYFINQQGKYRHYDNVFAGIIMIGLIGLITDQVLAWLGKRMFPWQRSRESSWVEAKWRSFVTTRARRIEEREAMVYAVLRAPSGKAVLLTGNVATTNGDKNEPVTPAA